jgi:hypothetical protein
MEHVIHGTRYENVLGHVLPNKLEIGVPSEVFNIVGIAGDQIVDSDDPEPFSAIDRIKCEPRKPAPPVTTAIFFVTPVSVVSNMAVNPRSGYAFEADSCILEICFDQSQKRAS